MRIVLIALSLFLNACSMGMLRVQSNPEDADVFVQVSAQQPKRIGKTPLNIPSSQISASGTDAVKVIVRADGFEDASYLVPTMLFEKNVQIDVKMKESKLPLSCTQTTEMVDKIARDIAKTQFFIQQKKFQQAENLLLNLLNDNPTSSVIYDLLGNVYYLDKKLSQALEAYENSIRLNPNGFETKMMVNKLRQIAPSRIPANGGGS
ncbi:MAG: tetratricopeptide repeat protein [Bdellovibrionales bacterium]